MSTWFRGLCQLHSGVYVNLIPGSMSTSFLTWESPCQLHSGDYVNFIPESMSTSFRGLCQLHSGVYVNFIPGFMSTSFQLLIVFFLRLSCSLFVRSLSLSKLDSLFYHRDLVLFFSSSKKTFLSLSGQICPLKFLESSIFV